MPVWTSLRNIKANRAVTLVVSVENFSLWQRSLILRCRCKHKHTDHDPVTLKCKSVIVKHVLDLILRGFAIAGIHGASIPRDKGTQDCRCGWREIPASIFAAMMAMTKTRLAVLHLRQQRSSRPNVREINGNHSNRF